jgi:hypothetical protein
MFGLVVLDCIGAATIGPRLHHEDVGPRLHHEDVSASAAAL